MSDGVENPSYLTAAVKPLANVAVAILFVVGDTLSDGVLVDDDCHSYEDIFFELHQVGVVQPDAAFAASCPY